MNEGIKKYSLALLLSLLIFLAYFHPITSINDDLGKHIKLGEIIWQSGSIPKINLFSYVYPTFPYINGDWISQIFFFLTIQYGGFGLLLLIMSLIPALATFLLIKVSQKKVTYSATILIAFFLSYGIFFDRLDLRPELLSFFFTAIFIVILYRYSSPCHSEASAEQSHSGVIAREAKRSNKETKIATNPSGSRNDDTHRSAIYKILNTRYLLFLLPILELLWVNVHVYFSVGIFLIFAFFIEELVNNWHRKAKAAPLGIILALSTIATLLNPSGLKGAIFPFFYSHIIGYMVDETQSIFVFFQSGQYYYPGVDLFLISLCIIFFYLLRLRPKEHIRDWLLFIGCAVLGGIAVRNLPAARIGIFILLAQAVDFFLNILQKRVGNPRIFSILFFVFFFIILTYSIYGYSGSGIGTGIQAYGEKAVDFFINEHIQGPIFNNITIGGYLDYRMYPEKVFVDNTPESYPVSFFQNMYIPMQQNPRIFAQLQKKYNFNSIIFDYHDQRSWANQFIFDIVQNPNWEIVYLDDSVVILVRKTKENTSLIQKFGMDKNTLHISHVQSKQSFLQIIDFFERTNWSSDEKIWLEKYLQLDPTFCIGLERAIYLESLSGGKRSLQMVYEYRYENSCR